MGSPATSAAPPRNPPERTCTKKLKAFAIKEIRAFQPPPAFSSSVDLLIPAPTKLIYLYDIHRNLTVIHLKSLYSTLALGDYSLKLRVLTSLTILSTCLTAQPPVAEDPDPVLDHY